MTFVSNDFFELPAFQAFLADMAALGVTPVAEGGRAYAVIAARSNARWWLLPLENRRASAAGLEMLHPVTRATKTAKTLMRVTALSGLCRLLGSGQVRFSGLPDISKVFGSEAVHVAYFTGTDGPHRKTSLQVMDDHGEILGYAKLSREEHVRSYIRNEAAMLARVTSLGLTSVDIPQVLELHENGDLTLLATDSCKSADVATHLKLGSAQQHWLEDLHARTAQLGAALLLKDLARRLAVVENVVGAGWVNRINQALGALDPVADEIELCLVHGDFTPWNSFVQCDRLYVFDWEYADPSWPVGYDLVHFMLASIPAERQPQELPRIIRRLASVHFRGKEEAARHALLLSLVCHALFYLGRIAEVHGKLSDWAEGPVRAALIDGLLDARRLEA